VAASGGVEARLYRDSAGEIRLLYRPEFDEAWLKPRIEETMERFRKQMAAFCTGL